jgi:hypothetical protein
MTGIVCALSPERLRIVESEPTIVHDLVDRRVEIPGRIFFDALRLPSRLRGRLPKDAMPIAACLEGRLGRGIGEKGEWAFGRPHVVDGDELARLESALDARARAASDATLDEDDARGRDDAFLDRLAAIVRQERARGGAVLVHVT